LAVSDAEERATGIKRARNRSLEEARRPAKPKAEGEALAASARRRTFGMMKRPSRDNRRREM
jgi:predicted secreted Zn-dependent protease